MRSASLSLRQPADALPARPSTATRRFFSEGGMLKIPQKEARWTLRTLRGQFELDEQLQEPAQQLKCNLEKVASPVKLDLAIGEGAAIVHLGSKLLMNSTQPALK